MKKSLFLILLMLCAWSGVNAQGYMFVNSETVFKAQADYNEAITKLETKTTENQKKIDDTYAQIETMYNNYQAQKSYLSDMKRTAREEEIIALEREVKKFSTDVMGPEGTLMKERVAMIKPIQERIFGAINKYAEANGYTMVIDLVNNQTLLYYSPKLDKTTEIINLLKQ